MSFTGGKIKGYLHQIKLSIGGYSYKSPIIFSNGLSDNAIAVLGSKGFFDHFQVTLNYKAGVISLSR